MIQGKKSENRPQRRIFLFSLLAFLTVLSSSVYSQNNHTTSPYTQFGYGQVTDQSFGSQRSMGGIGYGLRNSQMINPLNPASYSSVDSMTFMLDLAVSVQKGWLKDGNNRSTYNYGGLEYVAIQVPLAEKLGLGIGLTPLTRVGYNFGTTDEIPSSDAIEATRTYSGSGGLNKVYGTLSYNFFDRLSLGVNVGYLFGDIKRQSSSMPMVTGSLRTVWSDTLRSSGITYEIGAQYYIPINKKNEIIVGLVYTPKISIASTFKQWEISGATVGSERNFDFQMPETFGLGATYVRPNRLTVGVDFQYQRWSNTNYLKEFTKSDLSDRMKINAGLEYIPNHTGYNFFSRMRYRVGGYYTNSYIKVENTYGYDDFGATLGFGFPLSDRRSFINLGFEYNLVNPEKRSNGNMIDEQYLRFTLSYTFNELWFFKRKLQ